MSLCVWVCAAESAARRGDFAEAEKLQALANNKRSEATPIKRLYNDVYEALRTAKCMLQTAMVNKQWASAGEWDRQVKAFQKRLVFYNTSNEKKRKRKPGLCGALSGAGRE